MKEPVKVLPVVSKSLLCEVQIPHPPISCDGAQDSATHGTIKKIANRLMAVSERSSLAGAFKRVLIHDILRWKVGGSESFRSDGTELI